MRRYLEVYRLMLRNSLVREMSFKANFLMWIVVECLWFVGQIVFLEVMFSHVNAIGGWTKWECILLVGTHQIVAQVFQGLFFVNLSELPELVRRDPGDGSTDGQLGRSQSAAGAARVDSKGASATGRNGNSSAAARNLC